MGFIGVWSEGTWYYDSTYYRVYGSVKWRYMIPDKIFNIKMKISPYYCAGDKIQNEMGRTCSLDGETWGKDTTGETQV
jgi:hypothetical protein